MGIIYRDQNTHKPEAILVARWPDGCLFRRLSDFGLMDSLSFEIRKTLTSGGGFLDLRKSTFDVRLPDGDVSFDGRGMESAFLSSIRRVRWALDALGLRSRYSFPMMDGPPANGRFAAYDPYVIRIQRGRGKWADPMVNEVGRILAHHRELNKADRLHEVRDNPEDSKRVRSLLQQLEEGIGIEPGYCVRIGMGDSAKTGPWIASSVGLADELRPLWTNHNTSIEWLWRELLFPQGERLLCESREVNDRRVALVTHDEYEDWIGAQLDPGTFSVPQEELEVYSLLGEPLPYLWEDSKLLEWASSQDGD